MAAVSGEHNLETRHAQHREGTMMVDKIFDRSNAVYVKNVPRKGRGVFANVSFKVGDLIERAPTWGFGDVAGRLIDGTGLFEYYFVRHYGKPERDSMTGYVVFGFISIVNHSSDPNAKIVWADEDSGAWASIVAIRDINVDEEITHCYTNISSYPPYIKFIA
ncbi:SET domain-containing protein-lysine N-methyltransferase [Mesorhizobium sp. M1380]|uniref:SET domain-containing protein-lysine N-methyltransferase n=1 Tax=Mesorhizobium sp. M1380 TaxID=2957093 RepID=UPI0033367423